MREIPIQGSAQSGCPSQRAYLADTESWRSFWKPCGQIAPAAPDLSRGVVAICTGKPQSGGGIPQASAFVNEKGWPTVIVSPGQPNPLTVIEDPCVIFQVPIVLAGAQWNKIQFVDTKLK
jgi:hypothetical protein